MKKSIRKLSCILLCIITLLSVMSIGAYSASYSPQNITEQIDGYLNGKMDTKCPSGTTCWKFSRDLSYFLFGRNITFPSGTGGAYYLESKGDDYNQIGQVKNCSTQAVVDLLIKALPGDVIQYASSFTNPYHTCIVKSISDSEIVIVEAATTDGIYYYRSRTIGLDADSIGKWNSADLTRCGFGSFNSSTYGMTLYRYKNVEPLIPVGYSYEVNDDGTATLTEIPVNENGTVYIPAKIAGHDVSYVATYYLSDNSNFKNFEVDQNNKYYCNDDFGVLFNKDKTILIQYPTHNERTVYTVPTYVEIIGDSAFDDSDNLEEIIISDGVKEIGGFAFSHCDNLKRITIPKSVKIINYSAFSNKNNDKIFVHYEGSIRDWNKIHIEDVVVAFYYEEFFDVEYGDELTFFEEILYIIELYVFGWLLGIFA